MAGQTSFGRRQVSVAPPRPAVLARPAPRPAPAADDLSPAAEAFRAQLAAGKGDGAADFADWRRSQRLSTLASWALGLALLAPGLITFAVDLPLPITLALEVLGLVGNWWLRRERQRRLKAITTWDPADAR
jgi:hypothetical protein